MSEKTTEKLKVELEKKESGEKAPTLFESLEAQRDQIERALPGKMDADRFTRIVLTTVRATPALEHCTPTSILAGCMVAAQLGLEPGPLGHSYLVPRMNKAIGRKEAQFQIGYKGAIDLVRRSGQLKDIKARTVYAEDEFDHSDGIEETLVHKPNYGNRKKVRLYYLIVRLMTGGVYVRVAEPPEIEAHRKRSKAGSGPWQTDYEAMAWKTLVHMSKPWLPLTAEAAAAFALDNAVMGTIGPNTVEEEAAKRDVIDADSEEVEYADDDPERPFE